MAATECVVEESILRKFAQKLASNEKRIRDMTLKKLRKWMETRLKNSDGGFSEVDFLKLWKGLHFSMWMADKPLIQEDLADKMSGLIHCIGPINARLLFIDTFFQTQAREWFGIDRYRLDKFMMLIRRFLGQSFAMLKSEEWNLRVLSGFTEVLAKNVINGTDEVPNGLKYHIADIYLDELAKAGADELTVSQIQRLLDPYCLLLAETNDKLLFGQVMKKIFKPILAWSTESLTAETSSDEGIDDDDVDMDDSDEEDKGSTPKRAASPRLKVDCGLLADSLFELASEGKCVPRHRGALYNLVKKLRQLDAGDVPEGDEEEVDNGEVVDEDAVAEDSTEFDSAVSRLQSMYQEHLKEAEAHRLAKKKRRHKYENDDSDDGDDDTAQVPPAKIAKRAVEEEKATSKKELTSTKEKKQKQRKGESARDLAKAARLQRKLLQQQKLLRNNDVSNDEDSSSESDSDDEQSQREHTGIGNGIVTTNSNGIKSSKTKAASNSHSALPKSKKSKSEQGLFIGGFENDEDNNFDFESGVDCSLDKSKKTNNSDKLQKKKKHAKSSSVGKVSQGSNWEVKPIHLPDSAEDNKVSELNTSNAQNFKVSPKVQKETTSPSNNSANKKVSPKPVLHMKENSPATKQSPKETPNKESFIQFVQNDSPSAVFFKKAAKSLSPQSPKKKSLMLTPQATGKVTTESSSSKKKVIFAMDRNCARNYNESIMKLSSSPLLTNASVLAKSILKSSPAQQNSPVPRMNASDFF